MKEIKDRIRQLRKTLNLTQAEFSKALGAKPSLVGVWEIGAQAIPETRIYQICKEFHVNREWLETGAGEMFETESESISFADQIAAMYVSLPDVLKQVWREAAQKIIEAGDDQEKAAKDATEVIKQLLKKDC